MINIEELKKMGTECGFTCAEALDVSTIKLMPEVRDMCAQNTCGRYGKNWRCPPAIGTLEECERKVRAYQRGILVQTVGHLEDEFDGETMMETEAVHKENFSRMKELLEKKYPGMLSCGSGTCTRCAKCTYPEVPCRFPEDTFGSMEAYGMLVTQVCQANNVAYYHGKCTITYTGCFLLE